MTATPQVAESGIVYFRRPVAQGSADPLALPLKLETIDPQTGVVNEFRTFTPPSGVLWAATRGNRLDKALQHRNAFSSNFDRVVAVKPGQSEYDLNVGWIDRNGKFTDVSATNTAASDEYQGGKRHVAPVFGPDDSFYYLDAVADKVMRLAPNTTKAVPVQDEKIKDDRLLPRINLYVAQSGTITVSGGIDVEGKIPGLIGIQVDDWVNDTDYITQKVNNAGSSYNPIYYCTALPDGKSQCSDPLTATTAQILTSPVADPGGTKIAFLAKSTDSQVVTLYVMPRSGGSPTKVPAFESAVPLQLVDWK